MKSMSKKQRAFLNNFETHKANFDKLADIAAAYDVSRTTIHNWIKRNIPYFHPNKNRRYTVLDLLNDGYTVAQVAAMTRTTRTSVLRIIREHQDRPTKFILRFDPSILMPKK